MPKPELTSAESPVLVHPAKELQRQRRPGRQPPVRADQLQPRRGDRRETVELEGEEDSPWPRPFHTISGIP